MKFLLLQNWAGLERYCGCEKERLQKSPRSKETKIAWQPKAGARA